MLLLAGLAYSPAQGPDLNFQQSPARPAPDWLHIIDQGQLDSRLNGYFTPEGFKVEIVAEEPAVINPVGMTFGPDGTLYVLEWVPSKDGSPGSDSSVVFTYKDGSQRKVAIMRKPTKDWIKLLSDTTGKGVYDSARVILHEELPSSILIHDDWLYVTGQGTVRRYPLAQVVKDSQAGKRDFTPQVIAQGFCGYHHHQVSGLTIGNDGWLYVTAGDDDNFVEGSDGSRATVLRTGAIFRCRPDGSRMHAYAMGFRNPYRDVAFDSTFNLFHADNDNEDGSKFTGCRLMHIPEGVDFGWRLRVGARCCVPDKVRAAVFGELPGKVAPMLKTGRGAPAGLLIYNDTFLPERYRGWLLYPDVFRKLIRAYKVEPRGATFEVTQEFELMKSADPLFRPCQMVLGPDGAIYVCDWRTDSGGAGRLFGDGKHGRIYRITWAGTNDLQAIPTRAMDSWAKIVKQSSDDLLKTLDSDNFSDRQQAQRELVRRGAAERDKLRPALLAILNDGGKPLTARLAALGAVQSFWNAEVKNALIARLKDGSPDVRRLCADGLALNGARGDRSIHDALVAVLNDDDPAVLRALYVGIGKIGAGGSADVIVNALEFDEGKDAYLRDGMVRALEYVGKEGFEQLIALSNSGELKELQRVVEVYPAFRSREAAVALGALLRNYHLTPVQRAALIRSYTNYQLDPPISLQPLSDYLAQIATNPPAGTTPEELVPVKLAALEVLSTNGAMNSDKVRAMLVGMLGDKNPDVRVSVIQAVQDARATQAAPLLAEMLGRSGSQFEKLAIVRALGALQQPATAGTVERLLTRSDTEPSLRLAALRALGAIDYRKARKSAAMLLSDRDLQVQQEAVVLLGRDADGARLVGQRFVQNELPRSLLPLVADGLRRFAKDNPASAKLLAEVMKGGLLLSSSPEDVARIAALVQKQGSAKRGRELYLNNKALACITCHRLEGVGGNVGPDLTRIWETHSLEKVMEAILDPSKEIKEGYQAYVAVTTSGQVVTGLKVAQNDQEVVLRDATGKEVHIAKKDLDGLTASKKSLMPDDVVTHLSFGEFIDLIAFLRDRLAQEALRKR
jgi:putative membrane-bound dehydrogenase-like protein